MQFYFKAKKSDGKITDGVQDAPDKLTLAQDLRKKGLSLFSAERAEGNKIIQFLKWLNETVIIVGLHEKIVFAKNLSAMINAGLSISRALEILEKQTNNKKLKQALGGILNGISQGKTLSEGLQDYPRIFSPLFVAMVHAGEESGGLSVSLKEISLHLEQSYILLRKVRGALIYPAIVVAAIIIIGILMLIFVVPTLTSTFKELNVALPVSTRFIIKLSDILSNYTIISLVGLIALGITFFWAIRTKKGGKFFDFVILRIPFIGGLVREVNTARTTRTLSSLITAGVPITQSTSITTDVLQNFYYKEALFLATGKIEKGATIASVFKENTFLYPIMVGEMIEVGEETGKLSEMLLDVAHFYEEQVSEATKDMSTIIEPVLMLFIGGAVGFFAISMISPIYSLTGSI
ncbi:MAG: type II secretion system F family protein [Patescibacteria group bacterium]